MEVTSRQTSAARWMLVAYAAVPLTIYGFVLVNVFFAVPMVYELVGRLDWTLIAFGLAAIYLTILQADVVRSVFFREPLAIQLGWRITKLHVRIFSCWMFAAWLPSVLLQFLGFPIPRRYERYGILDPGNWGNLAMTVGLIVSSIVLLRGSWKVVRAFRTPTIDETR